MNKKGRVLQRINQYSSASESYKDTDRLGSMNLKPSIANSHVRDMTAYKWDKEKAKSFQPYNDHKFNRIYKLPSNEVAFMGGVGVAKGNTRSLVHIGRANEVQKILKMRTGNRSLYTLTEDSKKSGCTVPHAAPVTRKNEAQKVRAIVDKVWMANNFEDKAKSSDSDSVYLTRHVKKPASVIVPAPVPNFQEVQQIRCQMEELFKIPDELLEPRESFTEWALKERERFKQRRAQMAQKQEKNVTETLSIPDETESMAVTDKGRRTRKKDVIQHISGFMYGQFTKAPTKNRRTTKFGIPLSMIDRAKEAQADEAEKNKKLRRARISHMKLPVFFDEPETEENDVMETVKAITLVRTPFLRFPKITTQKKRRRDRIKSKYLKQDRLNRITMLLYDRSYEPTMTLDSIEEIEENLAETNEDAKPGVDVSKMSKQHKRYVEFIKENYAEQMKSYAKDGMDDMTFEQFKETEMLGGNRTKSSTPLTSIEHVKVDDEQLPVVKTKKNLKFDRSDQVTGPFYIDPEQIEKAKDPTMFKSLPKYYTSLMRSRWDTRDRLQVIGTDFENERSGAADNSHCLMTEYDNYYIHELQYRKPIRKFCPKTDILNIRASVRKKFIDFYMQENLQHLMREQAEEKKYLDDIDKFSTIVDPLFERKKFQYFEHMNQQIASLAPTLERTQELERDKEVILAELEIVNDKLIKVEIMFAHYLVYMNFYKRMLPPEWKMDNVELFEGFEKSLDFLLNTSKKLQERDPEFVAHGDEEMEAYDLQLPEASTELLIEGIKSVKFRVKGLLHELVQMMWLADKIIQEYNRIKVVLPLIESTMTKNALFQDKKLSFVEERNYVLKYDISQIAKQSLAKCVKNPVIRKISAICDQLYKNTVPEHLQNRHQKNEPVIDKFAFIQDYVLDLLHELDEIPVEIVKEATKEVNVHHKFIMKQASSCVQQQNRFEMMKKQLKFHFTTKKPKSRRRRSPSPFQAGRK